MSKRVKKWKRNIPLTSIARLSEYAFAIPMRGDPPFRTSDWADRSRVLYAAAMAAKRAASPMLSEAA